MKNIRKNIIKSAEVSLNNEETENKWFEDFKNTPEHQEFLKKPVAYFCAEYALFSYLPTYAGGLGILAGDYIREVGNKQFPMRAVGLYYRQGQNVIAPANLTEEKLLEEAGLKLIIDEKKERVLVSLPIQERVVYAQGWIWEKDGTEVYLLDTNVPENHADDRGITSRLYTDDRTMRLKQEMLLGIGGFRLLEQLGIHCSVYHLNEGHSAFLVLELARHEMKHQHTDFHTACDYAAKHIVFTNHTLIAAGQELFTTELVSTIIQAYAKEMEVTVADIVALGTIEGSNLFSMTTFSLAMASKINAVSKLHSAKALEIWPKHPMENVTNGIYLPQWDKIKASENELWSQHQKNKREVLEFIKEKTGEKWDENTLLLGWARRLVAYKRPLIFLEEIDRLISLAQNEKKPLRIVFAGPTDQENSVNNEFLVELKKILEEKLKGIAVFLPNYNIELAKLLVSGCDVWLNTPVVGSEACGTSSMKALLNGCLPLSTRDGWIAEVELSKIGWVVDEPNVGTKMMDLVEKEIIPEYYDHLQNPDGSKWILRMENARKLITEQFSTTRMLRQYIENLYIPVLRQKHEHKYE